MRNTRSGPAQPRITEAVREELSLLQPKQVAELLGVNVNWLYDRIEAGDIAAVRLGHRSLRFRPEDVKAFIDANRVQENSREARLVLSVEAEQTRPRRGRPRRS